MQDIAIETRHLTKKYGDFYALQDLNLRVERGEVLGFLGPNGAGKTTTIRLLLGLIKPSAGSSKIFGLDSQTQTVESHARLAYVPGESTFWPNLTGQETLHLLAKIHGSVDEAYRKQLIKRFQFDVKKKVRAYSKGNRQKISLIAALASRAELLIMDEPTSGLDPIMEQAFRQSVDEAKANGQTVFLSSHILEEVEALCDRVGILRSGRLVELGSLSDMKHLSALTVQATFGDQVPSVKHLKNVTAVQVAGKQLTCQVKGDITPLFKLLIEHHPTSLLSREPSLEELFLALYGDESRS